MTDTVTSHRVYEPGIGAEGNHLDVYPYVMDCRVGRGIATAALSIAGPDSVAAGDVHIDTDDVPALIAALQKIADLSEEEWMPDLAVGMTDEHGTPDDGTAHCDDCWFDRFGDMLTPNELRNLVSRV
jgi:hypothetical protein